MSVRKIKLKVTVTVVGPQINHKRPNLEGDSKESLMKVTQMTQIMTNMRLINDESCPKYDWNDSNDSNDSIYHESDSNHDENDCIHDESASNDSGGTQMTPCTGGDRFLAASRNKVSSRFSTDDND
jgi:hypothetical protein